MTGTAPRCIVTLAMAGALMLVLAAAPAAADEWPTVHGDAANTGYSNEVFDPGSFNFGWVNLTGNLVHSSPVTYGVGVWVGSVDDWLYCLDWADGHAYWLYDTGAPVWSSAAVYRDWVYFPAPGTLYMSKVFDPTTTLSFPLSDDREIWYTSPKIAANTVFLVGSDGNAYALNATNGARLWKTWIGNTSNYVDKPFANESVGFDYDAFVTSFQPYSWVWSSCPAYYKNRLYTGSPDGGLWVLDATTGDVLWRYQVGGPVVGGVAVANNTAYFGSLDGYLYAVDSYTGELRWKANLQADIWSTPAVGNGYVYIGGANYDGTADGGEHFYCIDATTGVQEWVVPISGNISSSAAVTSTFVTFGGEDGVLYVLNATSGEELMRFETQGKITSSPAISNGWIFFSSWDYRLYGIGYEVTIINNTTPTTPLTTSHFTPTATTTPSASTLATAFAAGIAVLAAARAARRR